MRERSAEIYCDLGAASNADQGQKRINPQGENPLGRLAALLPRHRSQWTCSSLAPCHSAQNPLARGTWVFQQSPKVSRPTETEQAKSWAKAKELAGNCPRRLWHGSEENRPAGFPGSRAVIRHRRPGRVAHAD